MQKKILTVLLASMFMGSAWAEDKNISIPAQDVPAALLSLSSQTGVQLLFTADELKSFKTKAISGVMSVEDALASLLKDTNYTFRASGKGAYVLQRMEEIKLNEVIVNADRIEDNITASRSNTPLDRAPQSVATVSKSTIENQGVKTVSDALRNVSNVSSIDARDSNNTTFRVRGFSSSTVVDGVAMPGYSPNLESLVNVERIDVVKGPAGNLFGSSQGNASFGTMGGTIAITTGKANAAAPLRQVGIKAGSFGERGASFDVNQPLGQDVAVRMQGETSRADSETDRVFFKKTALFPSLTWKPSADTELVARVRYLDNAALDYSGLPPSGTLTTSTYTVPRNRVITAEGLPESTNKSRGINLQWLQRLSEVWNFSVIAAYNEMELDQRGIFPATFGGTGPTHSLYGARMWEQWKGTTLSPSLNANFETGAVKHVLGTGVDYEKSSDDAFMLYKLYPTKIDLTNPVYPAWIEPVAPSSPTQKNRYTSTVAYVQDQLTVAGWHFLGSLRHAKIDVEDVNTSMAIKNISSHSKTTPRVGAVYEFTPQMSAFTGYSESIKVPTVAYFSAAPKPEESAQTEVGFRLSNFEGVSATLAWFDLVRKNVVVSDPARTGYSVQTGKQQAKGVDLDVKWQVTPAWALIAAMTSQTAVIVEDTTAARVNKQLFDVPERTLRLAARHDILGGDLEGLGFGLGLTHNSMLPGNVTNTFFTPASTVWDAQVSYRMKSARLGLNINNLTDEQYYVPSAYFGGGQVIPAAPRTLTVTANFTL